MVKETPVNEKFDRRKERRFRVEIGGVALRETPDGAKSQVRIRMENLSASGAFLLSEKPIPLKEQLELVLGESIKFKCEVVRTGGLSSGYFQIGVRFDPELDAGRTV
ncbi:MAG TPA: PilZ domain-containing protein [Acidobacteriota bacterium]|nr:PilZ domain-containing protein [Acidobacteriota bacterium]